MSTTYTANLFKKLMGLNKSQCANEMKIAYKKLNESFKRAIGWEGAFWAAMRTACLIVCCDGKFSDEEYNAFKIMTDSNPTYDELFNTANAVARDTSGAFKMACTSNETRLDTIYLLLAFCAYKGTMHNYEEALLRDLDK